MKRNIRKVLLLNSSGLPIKWVSPEMAAVYHCKDLVNYSFGEDTMTLFGGINKSNVISKIDIKPIISVKGYNHVKYRSRTPKVKNAVLFARDQYKCAYCNNDFVGNQLSKDHIVPVSRGGEDTWDNLVTACKRCNSHKGNKHLKEFGSLHFNPIRVSHQDLVMLSGFEDRRKRIVRIMTDEQFEYLKNFINRDLMSQRNFVDFFERFNKKAG